VLQCPKDHEHGHVMTTGLCRLDQDRQSLEQLLLSTESLEGPVLVRAGQPCLVLQEDSSSVG
jgi:hypothetical protein